MKQIVLSTVTHESSNRDPNTKIKINRSNRPHRILSSENMDINSNSTNQESKTAYKTQAQETVELIKELVEVVKEHEFQSNNLMLASECSDHLIEAYDVLLALQEISAFREKNEENRNRRETIENVAKHLISRLDMASNVAAKATSGSVGDIYSSLSPSSENSNQIPNYHSASNNIAWEESSIYSHTTG